MYDYEYVLYFIQLGMYLVYTRGAANASAKSGTIMPYLFLLILV